MPELNQPYEQERQLLDGLKNGCVQTFEKIFKLYWKPLYNIAVAKLHDHAEAEEVIQNIFSSLWEQREKLDIENLGAYLNRAVKNRILNSIRAKITQQKYWEYYQNFIPKVHNGTENAVAFVNLQESLEEAVNHLPEKSRLVFQMSRFEGRTNPEIAKVLKLSEKSIEYHLTQSLKKISVYMRDYMAIFLAITLPL